MALPPGTARCAAVLALALALAGPVRGQDPAIDLPARRVPAGPDTDWLALGLQRLAAGWRWEAAAAFRELAVREPGRPAAHLGLALALRAEPRRAARLCWSAVECLAAGDGAAPPDEGPVVRAYARWSDVASVRPDAADPRFDRPPDGARDAALLAELEALAAGAEGGLAAALLRMEQRRRAGSGEGVAAGQEEAVLAQHHAWLAASAAMPFEVPGYRALLARARGGAPRAAEGELARLPRHPHFDAAGSMPVGPLPGFSAVADRAAAGADRWQPRPAPGYDLPRGLGGRGRLADHADRPLLVVFFLGFGCVHCVAQLADLEPLAPQFRAAGIEVVTIGTDSPDQVRAARQAALENGIDPLHFDVLCDPAGDVFRRWGAWDEFAGEALHGTFLVDAQGRILWQDVSARPFAQTEFLLGECRRLLAAWQ